MKVWILGLLTVACFGTHGRASGPQTAIMVPISQLLAAPARYTGKKISTRGYYSSDGHSPVLCADATAARGTEGRARIFLDFENSPIPRRSLSSVQHGYVDVTGTFQYRKFETKTGPRGERVMTVGFGWMNSYEKQITGITTFAKVPAPKR
jgi:hypothetical protein